jgi:hypothetical protein
LQKKTVAFRCAWYLVVPQTGYIYTHYLFSSPGFYGTTVVNVLPGEWFTIICQNLIIQHSIDWFSELPLYHRNLFFLTYKMDAVVRIVDYRLVNILWLKIMHWIWRKGSAEVIKIIFSLGYITVFIYFW